MEDAFLEGEELLSVALSLYAVGRGLQARVRHLTVCDRDYMLRRGCPCCRD